MKTLSVLKQMSKMKSLPPLAMESSEPPVTFMSQTATEWSLSIIAPASLSPDLLKAREETPQCSIGFLNLQRDFRFEEFHTQIRDSGPCFY